MAFIKNIKKNYVYLRNKLRHPIIIKKDKWHLLNNINNIDVYLKNKGIVASLGMAKVSVTHKFNRLVWG